GARLVSECGRAMILRVLSGLAEIAGGFRALTAARRTPSHEDRRFSSLRQTRKAQNPGPLARPRTPLWSQHGRACGSSSVVKARGQQGLGSEPAQARLSKPGSRSWPNGPGKMGNRARQRGSRLCYENLVVAFNLVFF